MPIYKYKCDFCGYVFTELQSMSEPELKDCPECKDRWKNGKTNTLKKQIGSPMVIFKGPGFYCTDNPSQSQQNSHAQRQSDLTEQAKKDKIKEH